MCEQVASLMNSKSSEAPVSRYAQICSFLLHLKVLMGYTVYNYISEHFVTVFLRGLFCSLRELEEDSGQRDGAGQNRSTVNRLVQGTSARYSSGKDALQNDINRIVGRVGL
uniref:Uncharacterized protein n=1 Tax=Anopheles atroparvus TaxID=41427 RepID=A0A182ITR4_ANOAO